MKKVLAVLLIALVSGCFAATAAAQSVQIHSAKVTSLRPNSFSSLSATVTVNLTSEREDTEISNISAIVYSKDGSKFVNAVANPVLVRKGTTTVAVSGTGTLTQNVSFFSFFRNISLDPASYTADVICTVKTGDGEPHQVEMKGASIGQYK